MSALRWWLLILGVVFFGALALWELRRPRQGRTETTPPPEPARSREPPLELPEMHAHEPLATRRPLPVVELPEETSDTGEYPVLEVAPFGAAAVSAADEPDEPDDAEDARADEAPAHAGREAALAARAPEEPPGEADFEPAPVEPEFEVAPESAPAVPSAAAAPVVDWPPDEQRRVVALRLVAPQPERFAGRSLRQALAAEGFVLGRFDIFHKSDEDRRAILSAASLNRPGTFDADTMDSQHFGGLSLFAVLPGPKSPPEAFEELVSTARSLNDRLCGVLQDEGGTPLTPQRIASLRARINSGAPA
jgi:cell division protein ZipA